MNVRDSNRLLRLERLVSDSSETVERSQGLGVSEFLQRDDPERLAAFLAAAKRSGLCEAPPDINDQSRLAQFLRAAWKLGLIQSNS